MREVDRRVARALVLLHPKVDYFSGEARVSIVATARECARFGIDPRDLGKQSNAKQVLRAIQVITEPVGYRTSPEDAIPPSDPLQRRWLKIVRYALSRRMKIERLASSKRRDRVSKRRDQASKHRG